MRHKHADMIIEWAETGKTVEYFDPAAQGYIECGDVITWNPYIEYRFKPEVIRYKRYILSVPHCNPDVCVINENEEMPMYNSFYIKWIDTEWQEVEV